VKLAQFDTFSRNIDQRDACFNGLDLDWQALHDRYREEIAGGVSAGRFVSIMNHLALALKDVHTYALNSQVNFGSYPRPGLPLMFAGNLNYLFGACLTPLPDRSLLVYRVAPNHPLGLAPGDRVLGYEGRPWNELYQELLAAELPIASSGGLGSTDTAVEHAYLASAGLNWHVFDTIDIVRHESGETVHLPTSLMQTYRPADILCAEQMDIPGIVRPEALDLNNDVRWGLVEGTRVGYIYVYDWVGNVAFLFREAIRQLTQVEHATGLIIDFRLNLGGNMFLSNPGLNLLFRDPTPTIAFADRASPTDHLAMRPLPSAPASSYVINPVPDADFYDKPIAVLTGPGAVSSGDQVALRMTFHPQARLFGEPTSGAFNGPQSISIGAGWSSGFCGADAYRLNQPGRYLTHTELNVDYPTWLEPGDVALGEDTVVKKALRWIGNRPPIARITAPQSVECASPTGALADLDGSASEDPDSTPGTNDGITLYDWFEDWSLSSETYLGRGRSLQAPLSLGDHQITLRVTDEFGEQSLDQRLLSVVDTTPPRVDIFVTPAVLWPPDHRLVDVRVDLAATDACGGSRTVLAEARCTELPRASGGAEVGYCDGIQDADVGQPDFGFALRAERSGTDAGRVYSIAYTVTDESGNQTLARAQVRVPLHAGPP
jgi:hypothetical protein